MAGLNVIGTVDASLIIVSWNTKDMVAQCLDSLKRYAEDSSIEIIVVDNASSDGTAECIRERFPHVRLIRNATNIGFARGNNIGIKLSTGKYVSLINSDVQVPQGCLEKMLEYMEQHPEIGMLGPKMVLPDGSIGPSCMRFPTVWNWFCRALALDSAVKGSRAFGDFLMTGFKYDRIADVDALTGWFWVVRRDALNQVGPLDERFFMYGEDIDWPKRFHQSGWKVVFYPEAEAIHHRAASSSQDPTRFYIEMNRASIQYFQKHHDFVRVVGFWLTTWLHQVIRIVGYGFIYLFRSPRRSETRFKVKRSVACLLWLMGLWETKPLEAV
jgi:GT2 family glycosyltransferase